MNRTAKWELLATIRGRYREPSRKDKSRILGEFIAVSGQQCKHGIRPLAESEGGDEKADAVRGRRIYDEAVREALIVSWEASDRICGKRLRAALPHLVESMERHGRLGLDSSDNVTGRLSYRESLFQFILVKVSIPCAVSSH